MTDYKITVESERASLVLSPTSLCRLIDGGLAGFDIPKSSVAVRPGAFYDGGWVGERRVLPRRLALTFEITDLQRADEARDTAIRLADPHSVCKLTVTVRGRTRTISAVPYPASEYRQKNFTCLPVVTLCFIAPDPYFEETEPVAASTIGPVDVTLENSGDTDCGLTVVLAAEGGDVYAPFITDGKHTVGLSATLTDGQRAVIDTARGKKSVTVDGKPSAAFTLNSEFFSLPVGKSRVNCGAERGIRYLTAEILFREKFLGI